MNIFQNLLICLLLFLVKFLCCQDCIDYGKRCSDTGQCCGGCCLEGICIDTYRSCHDARNPCLDHYCLEGTDCHLFKPENCPECDVQAICA